LSPNLQGSPLDQIDDRLHQGIRLHNARLGCGIMGMIDGLEQAPSALGMLFDGTNQGKLIIRIA
jgi:NADPH-dependent curcumin reductase CurA